MGQWAKVRCVSIDRSPHGEGEPHNSLDASPSPHCQQSQNPPRGAVFVPKATLLDNASMTSQRQTLRLPVVAASSEYLVMGHLMRRNILTYKAPPHNEGYDLICIHPDPRHKPQSHEVSQVRIQVKSRYQTDCDRGFPIQEKSLDAFDFLVIVFLNIGKFYGKNNGLEGCSDIEFYTLPADFVRAHHQVRSSWQKVILRGLEAEIEPYQGERGFEQIANILGIPKPYKSKLD
jgi:hypothetical protein